MVHYIMVGFFSVLCGILFALKVYPPVFGFLLGIFLSMVAYQIGRLVAIIQFGMEKNKNA